MRAKQTGNSKSAVDEQTTSVFDGARRLDWPLIATILAIKVFILLFAVQVFYISQNTPIATWYGWLEIWNRWDAPHYLYLARNGYPATGEFRTLIVFYPLYPLIVRLSAFVFQDYLISALLISSVASVAAGLLLRHLVELDEDGQTARRAVWFMFIFPTSFFLHIGYTESLFMALALGSFLAARKDYWWAAGVLGALAALTRINGSLLIPALAIEAFAQYRRTRRFNAQWLWIVFPACGFLLYLLVNYNVTGDAFMFQRILREHWHKSLTVPWTGIGGAWHSFRGRTPADAQLLGFHELFFIFLGLACTVWCWVKSRPSYAVWMTLNWLLWTSTSFIMSAPRYTLILFPIYILFARLAASHTVWYALITVWSLMFLSLFASRFAQGWWAF